MRFRVEFEAFSGQDAAKYTLAGISPRSRCEMGGYLLRKPSSAGCRMPGDDVLTSDDGPIFSTVAKLVEALERSIPMSHDLERKPEALVFGALYLLTQAAEFLV